jgi:hypothetical protein
MAISRSHPAMIYWISQTTFRPGGMVPVERNHPINAVRNTLVGAHSAPGVNTMRHVAYPLPITVSPFPHILQVFDSNQSLWRCGKLWPHIRMGLLGTQLHCNWNAMGDAAKISPRIPFIWAPNPILFLLTIPIIASHQINVTVDNPSILLSVSCLTTSSCLWNYVCVDDNVSHGENLASNGCRYFSHL